MGCREKIDDIVGNFKKITHVNTNKEAAQLLGISDRDFSNRKRTGTLFRIIVEWAANKGLNINEIVYKEDSEQEEDIAEPSESKAGRIQKDVDLPISKEWLSREITAAENQIIITISGNSMEPSLREGDIVVIDKGRTEIQDGGLFAVRMDGTLLIKRLSPRPGEKMKVISDNREYDSYEIDRSSIEIAGQVALIIKKLIK